MWILGETLKIIDHTILGYFIFSVIVYTSLLIGSFPDIIYYFKRSKFARIHELLESKVLPPVTIIIPAYNEHDNIYNAVQSALNSNYQNLYVFVVNDASTDDTIEILNNHYELHEVPAIVDQQLPCAKIKKVYVSKIHPNLMIFDKAHGGAGDSINVGLNACFTPYFMTFDADSIMDKFAVDELVYDMLTTRQTIAVGGGVYLLNACKYSDGKILKSLMPYKLAPAIQSCEYLRSHLFNRTGWNSFGGTMSYSGTATLFNRNIVINAGGFDTNNFAQDSEIIMRLHTYMYDKKIPHQIRFTPACSVWTDVPATFREFAKQRDHWRRGLLRSIFRNFKLLFNPKYKIQGLWCFPNYLLLEIMAPIVEFTAYLSVFIAYCFGIVNITLVILFIILAWGFTSYITVANMFLNLITFNRYKKLKDVMWIFSLCFLEMCGYRQFYVLVNMWGSLHYYFNRLIGKPQ